MSTIIKKIKMNKEENNLKKKKEVKK